LKKVKNKKPEKPQYESNIKMYPEKNPSPSFRKYQAQAYYEGWDSHK
jgi:hypothetical protein